MMGRILYRLGGCPLVLTLLVMAGKIGEKDAEREAFAVYPNRERNRRYAGAVRFRWRQPEQVALEFPV
jgi:hypothetical protein